METVVSLLSGGLDSSVLLWWLRDQGYHDRVLPLSVHYGQRHSRELQAAATVCQRGGFAHQVVDLSALRAVMKGSSQTDCIDVPEGHYAADTMRITVVPNRNQILLSVAAAYAISQGASTVAYAAHAGDRAQYPDCRPEFVEAMEHALRLCHYTPIVLTAPFVSMSKADIATLAAKLGVPINETWSCYKGGLKHCGKCGTCCERREAMYLAGVDDLTEYEHPDYWRTVCRV